MTVLITLFPHHHLEGSGPSLGKGPEAILTLSSRICPLVTLLHEVSSSFLPPLASGNLGLSVVTDRAPGNQAMCVIHESRVSTRLPAVQKLGRRSNLYCKNCFKKT